MSASNVTKAAWIHVIRVHDTTHLSVTTLRGSKRSRTTPHKERLSGLVKHRDYPPHSYIVNERCNPDCCKNWSPAQPQTLTQGGHEITSLLN